jgi:hypothetical protein
MKWHFAIPKIGGVVFYDMMAVEKILESIQVTIDLPDLYWLPLKNT